MRIIRNLIALVLFFFLIAIPLAVLGDRAFGTTELGFHLHPLLRPTLLFTVIQATLSLVASLILGGVVGVLLTRYDSPRLRGLLFASFSLPALAIVGLGFKVARLTEFGMTPIVFAHTYLNAPWIALAVIEARASFPKAWEESARSLGANPATRFFRLELPWVAPRVALAAAQVFALCVMSFTLVFLLGGGPASGTLETEIYSQVKGAGLDLSGASQFAVVQILLSALPLALASMVMVPGADLIDTSLSSSESEANPSTLKTNKLPIKAVGIYYALPLFGLLVGISPRNFINQLSVFFTSVEFWSALGLTALIALGSSLAAVLISLPFVTAKSKWLRSIAAFPLGISPLVLSLGFLLAYSKGVAAWIDPFEGSVTAMILLHGVMLLPLSIRFLLPVVNAAEYPARKNLLFAARTLGATPTQAWIKTEGPFWVRAVNDFSRIAFIWSFADLAVLSFFGSEKLVTIPLIISRLYSRYEFDAASVLLFLVALLSVFILMIGRGRK